MDLPNYRIPLDLKTAVEEIENPMLLGSVINYFLVENKFLRILKLLKSVDHPIEIEYCHYRQLLKLGLYLDELEQGGSVSEFKIRNPSIERVQHSKRQFKIYFGYLYQLKNLILKNSVLKNSDRLVAYQQGNPSTCYYLKVLTVCSDHVVVTASEKFCQDYNPHESYNVELVFNNYNLQRCHDALAAVASTIISRIAFPIKEYNYSQNLNSCSSMTLFNIDIANDPEQNQAVLNIVQRSAFPVPYVLYGPPGTGKTSTLVEAICQIWKHASLGYILVCATSNVACDVLTKKLLNYIPNTNDLYRLYSDFYDNYKIDDDIKKISNFNDNGCCDAITRAHFFNKKIIITTLCTAWRLKKFSLRFSHVIIDEAGQAIQPEAIIPLSLLKPSDYCQIVISGDNQLLGPDYIRSEFARKLLGQSILEKIMKREPYKKNPTTGYDPRFITKLIHHYRSPSDIIGGPNELFYNNELIVYKDERKWKTRTETIGFYAVEGIEKNTSNFKSSYNEHEISQVLFLVENRIGKRLGEKIIKGSDIGIVTSFTVQASKIREKLNAIGLSEVDVGNVEAYQGKEKEIIIVSTVQSKNLGFYWNSRRFNTAVTRAKTSLLLVGNPRALQTDKYWCYFLGLCQRKNAFHGRSMVISNKFDDARQGLTIGGGESKKSTDLFDEWLTNWEIDDVHDENIIAYFYKQCKPYYKATVKFVKALILAINNLNHERHKWWVVSVVLLVFAFVLHLFGTEEETV